MTGRLIDADDLFGKMLFATLMVAHEYGGGSSELGIAAGALSAVEKQPTVEAIPFKWIPFSEQKPSKTDDYLITYPISHEHAYVAIDQWLAEEGKWEAFRTEAVIAWAEIPKPYRDERPSSDACDQVSELVMERIKAEKILEQLGQNLGEVFGKIDEVIDDYCNEILKEARKES